MPRIVVEKAREGMKVVQNITDPDGMLLIPAGCVLGEKHLALLNSWNIAEIDVEEDSSNEPETNILDRFTPEALAALKLKVQARFYHFEESNPIIQEAFRLALLREAAAQLNHP